MKYLRSAIMFFLISVFINVNGQDIKVSVGEVKDSRTTGEYFAELEINLKLFGDILEKAKSIKCTIDKAVDDTERDLIKEEQRIEEFVDIDPNTPDRQDLTIKLKNPSRRASVVKELSGTLDVYIPKNDPGAVIAIKNFMGSTGNLKSNALKLAGLDVVVLTAEQYKSVQEQQKEKYDTSNVMGKLVEALSGLFGGFMEPGDNSIILQIQDPDSKVITIEFVDESGKVISPTGTSSTENVKVYDFEEQLPKDTQLKIYLETAKSMKKVGFAVKDIMLP